MNIVLMGMRGSGKSTIGELLAKKLKWDFVDIDKEIEKKEKKTIKDIVELKGWEHFRTVESQVTQKIATMDQSVISTGGGTILDPYNVKALKKNGKIIYLHVKPEIAAKRIEQCKDRPPLTDKNSIEEELKQLYLERDSKYRKSADIVFKRSENPQVDAEKIIITISR